MRKFDGEMVRTKVEKFQAIKEFLTANNCTDEELVAMCDSEMAILNKKSASARGRKDKDKEKEYADLEAQVLAMFEAHPILTNDDITLDVSTSKKTAIIARLKEKGLVKTNPKVKSKDKVSYSLVEQA